MFISRVQENIDASRSMESQLIQTSSEDEEKYIGIQGTYDSKGIIMRRRGKQDHEKANLIHIYVTLNSNNE